MFELNKSIYMTRAVAEELSHEHKQFIVKYLNENQRLLTDYMQVFDFYIENHEQWLMQKQEEPNRETTINIDLIEVKPIKRKVWVMDQVDHIIILFPEDY